MHHQVGVRMGDRLRDLEEQPQALAHAQSVAAAVGVDALAFDEFERQVGLAVVGHAGVVQPRDVRVLQRGQDLALARHALGQARASPRAVRELECDAAALQHVGAFGQPDRGHAAFANLAQQPVRADQGLARGPVIAPVPGPRRELVGLDLGQGVEHRVAPVATRHAPATRAAAA